MTDTYQERYLAHLSRKRRTLECPTEARSFWDVMASRRSQRVFDRRLLDDEALQRIYEAIRLAPSSCNRQAIVVRVVSVEGLGELDELLVGGHGWLHGAQKCLLLFADMRAYKSPAEIDFMPWLDAGFVAENVYLAAEASGIGVSYINPNIQAENRQRFREQFNPLALRFCGALALGCYDVRSPEAPKRDLREIFYPE